jgi:hypothetical protein
MVERLPKRQGSHLFQKGHVRIGGRVKGTPNKATGAMREIMKLVAASVGEDGKGKNGYAGWLRKICKKHDVIFFLTMAKLEPTKFIAEVEHTLEMHYETLEEAKENLAKEGLVIDHVLQ